MALASATLQVTQPCPGGSGSHTSSTSADLTHYCPDVKHLSHLQPDGPSSPPPPPCLQDARNLVDHPWIRNWTAPFSNVALVGGELHPIGVPPGAGHGRLWRQVFLATDINVFRGSARGCVLMRSALVGLRWAGPGRGHLPSARISPEVVWRQPPGSEECPETLLPSHTAPVTHPLLPSPIHSPLRYIRYRQ